MLEVWLSSYLPRALGAGAPVRETRHGQMIRSYAVVTPARDEADNLPRLAASLAAQTIVPRVVVRSSTTGRPTGRSRSPSALAAEHDWINVLSLPGASAPDRGAPIVRALQAGIAALEHDPPEILVNVDADISIEPDYFERLLAKFDADPALGIASGSAFELRRGAWEQRFVTGSTVWGASRAYRWECLQELLPLEERVGWDGVDEFKANSRGWRTIAFEELPLPAPPPRGRARRHGLAGAARTRARPPTTSATGPGTSCSARSGTRAASRRRSGWCGGMRPQRRRRAERSSDNEARAYLRRQQSPRNLRRRALEAAGRRNQPELR